MACVLAGVRYAGRVARRRVAVLAAGARPQKPRRAGLGVRARRALVNGAVVNPQLQQPAAALIAP